MGPVAVERWRTALGPRPTFVGGCGAAVAALVVTLDHLVDDPFESEPLFVYAAVAAFALAAARMLLAGSARAPGQPTAVVAVMVGAACAIVSMIISGGSALLLLVGLAGAGVALAGASGEPSPPAPRSTA